MMHIRISVTICNEALRHVIFKSHYSILISVIFFKEEEEAFVGRHYGCEGGIASILLLV